MNFDIKIDFIKTHDGLHNNLWYDFLLSTYEAQQYTKHSGWQCITSYDSQRLTIHNDSRYTTTYDTQQLTEKKIYQNAQ